MVVISDQMSRLVVVTAGWCSATGRPATGWVWPPSSSVRWIWHRHGTAASPVPGHQNGEVARARTSTAG
jgi:hypothetical protein